jgi:DNA-binding response OmpR family regulator
VSDQAVAPLIVFVVEDEELVRQLVAPSLEEAGYGIIEATGGEEALLILQKPESQAIRALVTDVDLGGKVTGWDVAHRAREINPSVAVVYMTGGSADQWSANGVPNSILITKPFAPAQVVTAVSQLLNTPPGAPS